MKTIKISLISLITVLTIIACKEDKKAQLAKLKKQQEELSQKISDLEKEVADTTSADDSKILKVTLQEIKPTEFKHFIEVQGRLDGEDNVDVQPEGAGGTVTEILVNIGDAVSKGQALARLNSAALADQLKALQANYELAKENFDRQQRLWDQKIGSEMQYLQAKANKDALAGQLSALKEQINMATIKSPINGAVEEVNIKIGSVASPASPIPAFRVVNFTSVKVKADVAEAYSDRISVGDNVTVSFPDIGRDMDAKITAVSRFINSSNRTFLVEARLNTNKTGFKANMIAVLKINDYKSENTVTIPVNYIQSDPNGNFVYIAQNSGKKTVAKKAFIEQGQSYNGVVEITKGLKPGDKVITSNYLELEEGETIAF